MDHALVDPRMRIYHSSSAFFLKVGQVDAMAQYKRVDGQLEHGQDQ